jgi:3-methyl-2-oxobutanoate hydroxymethyltransferase
MARLVDEGGVDMVLVGDSLGMIVQGRENTLPVTLDEMVYHTRAVSRGLSRAHLVADLPFMTYQTSVAQALDTAGRLVKEAGAESVKLEGGEDVAPQVHALVRAGIPVVGHVGLTPQSVHAFGGFKVQGRGDDAAEQVLRDALAIERAGAFCIVLEAIPPDLAAQITEALRIPTIGIGAGNACDGQVLVCTDLLGMMRGFQPKFAKRYRQLGDDIVAAVGEYASEVRSRAFPRAEHSYKANAPAAHPQPTPRAPEFDALDAPMPLDLWH